ncbi:hypothetical protein BLNAU_3001 [Blattamonas nauphoetae]|uniref:Uncharacterized protein n=1 Tax=Blattamonas nauphoetae TaxID=2049346 RepID=A0ABQ9YDV1_9EUKA|nr:hypothetical protein BLNAU_3001 [Blattamonas nauphoetae]
MSHARPFRGTIHITMFGEEFSKLVAIWSRSTKNSGGPPKLTLLTRLANSPELALTIDMTGTRPLYPGYSG